MENKNILITGGDKGIGRSIAELLAHSYQNVIITYNKNREGAESLATKCPNISYYQCNLSDNTQIQAVTSAIVDRFGNIDVLINNAGIESDASLLKMDAEQWELVIDVDLKALFYTTKSLVPSMIEKGWGRIINLSSILGYIGVYGGSNYSAAKAGVTGFTKSLAKELGGKGITVNAVAPGYIETDLLMRMPEKYREKLRETIPSHEFGRPEDIAYIVEFLVSDKAKYINGQTIHVNGGAYSI